MVVVWCVGNEKREGNGGGLWLLVNHGDHELEEVEVKKSPVELGRFVLCCGLITPLRT